EIFEILFLLIVLGDHFNKKKMDSSFLLLQDTYKYIGFCFGITVFTDITTIDNIAFSTIPPLVALITYVSHIETPSHLLKYGILINFLFNYLGDFLTTLTTL